MEGGSISFAPRAHQHRRLVRNRASEKRFDSLNVLEKMGDAARPALPEIKAALQSPFSGVRDRAGLLLRKLAPQEMPPIID